MPQLIKPGTVKILTNDGEVQVSISLDLTINLNTDGIKVAAQATEISKKNNESSIPDGGDWLIPDFDASPKIDFGKKN